jgi:hypothetical protein
MTMAAQVTTIQIPLTGLPTFFTLPHNFMLAKGHGYATVEHIQTTLEIFTWVFFHIGNNAVVQLVHITKAMLYQKARGLFTPHPTGADGNNSFIFQMRQYWQHLG